MRIALLILFIILPFDVVFAQKPIVIHNEGDLDMGDISEYVDIYQDKSRKQNIHEIQNQAFISYSEKQFSNISFSDVWWIKLKIINQNHATIRMVLNFKKQFFLDLFQKNSHKIIHVAEGGGFSKKITTNSPYSLPFTVGGEDSSTLYVRIVFDTFHIQHKDEFIRLLSEKTNQLNHKIAISSGLPLFLIYFFAISFLLFGSIFGILQYYLHKDRSILYYEIVIICSILIVLRLAELNLDFKLLPKYLPLLHPFQIVIELLLAAGYLLFFSIMFEFKFRKPSLYKLSKLLIVIYGILFTAGFIGTLYIIQHRIVFEISFTFLGLTTLFIMLSITSIVLANVRNKNTYKKYIVYGYFFMLLGYAIMVIINRTRSEYSNDFWSTPSVYMCIGTMLELLFFMLALNQKSRLLENEALTKGQNIERRRVAAELHDNVNSILASVKASLQTLNPLDQKDKQTYENVMQMVDNATREVRQISHNMLPVELEKEGLEHALQVLVIRLNLGGKIAFSLNMNDLKAKLEPTVAFNIYEICLELCQNIQKHSEATQANIEFEQTEGRTLDDTQLILFVSDNGKGFDKLKIKEGMGFKNIKHRAKSIGADLRVQSHEGEGTTFYIILPH